MKSTGFNPRQLVARGVFDSLEEADAVLCDFDDARPGPTIVGVSWLQGFKFQVPILPAACAVGAGLPSSTASGLAKGGAVESAAGVVNTSRRSPELLPAADSVLCPWCALERAQSGQGSAARTGFVPVARCERHSAEPPAAFLAPSNPQNQPAA